MRPKTAPFIILIFAFISGCATSVQLTLASDPAGATVYAGEKYQGSAPLKQTHELGADGCITLDGISVRWASGAASGPVSLRACESKGLDQAFIFVRPTAVPGQAFDIQFEKHYVHNELFVRDARNRTMSRSDLNLLYRELHERNSSALRSKLLDCSSAVAGNRIETTCE